MDREESSPGAAVNNRTRLDYGRQRRAHRPLLPRRSHRTRWPLMGRIWMKNYPGLMRELARAQGRFSLLRESFKAPSGTNGDTRAPFAFRRGLFPPPLPSVSSLPVCLSVCRSTIRIRSIIKRLIIRLIAPGFSSATLGTVDFRRPNWNNLIYSDPTHSSSHCVPARVHIPSLNIYNANVNRFVRPIM